MLFKKVTIWTAGVSKINGSDKIQNENTVENESTLFTGRVHSSGMESGRPRADFWCERTDAEYVRHMHTKHKL